MLCKHARSLSVTFGAIVLSTQIYAEPYDFREGWRDGVVVRLGTTEQIGKQKYSDCRESLTTEQLASGRFALISFSHLGRSHLHVALVREKNSLQAGDRLHVNVSKCNEPIVLKSAQ